MSGKYRKDHNCLNCGFNVEEHYCSRCGQPNLELKEDFWQFISHSVAHYFHFDNKFFKTLVPLVSKPGKVTLDYLAGKRARYINPISMYIFVSIVYFIVVYAPKKHEKTNNTVNFVKAKPILDSISTPLAGVVNKKVVDKTQEAIEESFDKNTFTALPFKQQDTIIKDLRAKYQATKSDSIAKLIKRFEPIYFNSNDSTYAAYLSRQKALPADQKDNIFERFMAKRKIGIGQNAKIIQEQLDHNRPKQYFLFMPLMALFIMINFRKNHIRYLDHLIFTIHGMTAFFLVMSVVQTLKNLFFANLPSVRGIVEILLIAWICWYLYKSLKIFYQRKTSTTIWRMLWIIVLYALSVKISEMIIVNIIYYIAT
jgi:ribosomal protein L37E